MILVIDNYDSFVYNLARYFERSGYKTHIIRNDAITVEEVAAMAPEAIVISPGPCSPKEAGISVELIRKLGPHTPILGVCLGHQCIGEAYGATIVQTEPAHGKASAIHHAGLGIFEDVPQYFLAGRYHSLSVQPHKDLVATAGADNIIMAMQHRTHPVFGVQFHPESVLTPCGAKIIENFMTIADNWNSHKAAA